MCVYKVLKWRIFRMFWHILPQFYLYKCTDRQPPYADRNPGIRLDLLSSYQQTEVYMLEASWELELQQNSGPWLLTGRARDSWQCRFEYVSEFEVSDVGKSTELATATLWDLGLTKPLKASAHILVELALIAYIFFRPFFLCFLAKYMVIRKLGFNLLRDSDLHILLVVVSVPFSWSVVLGTVLGIGHVCTKAHGSQSSSYTWREREN